MRSIMYRQVWEFREDCDVLDRQRKGQIPGPAVESIIVLCVGALFLISNIYQYVSCRGPGYPIFKALVVMAVGTGMFYISDKW